MENMKKGDDESILIQLKRSDLDKLSITYAE
jgi:hypothetical protein